MSQPAGTDLMIDALRTAVLGIAATHQSYLLARSGPSDAHAHGGVVALQREQAQTYRREAKRLLARACTQMDAAQSDTALVAVQAIALIDIFSGGSGEHWARNVALGKALVSIQYSMHYGGLRLTWFGIDSPAWWTSYGPSPSNANIPASSTTLPGADRSVRGLR
jgi:hypothetical protein